MLVYIIVYHPNRETITTAQANDYELHDYDRASREVFHEENEAHKYAIKLAFMAGVKYDDTRERAFLD